MPNSTRLCVYIDMPGHLGHVKLLCAGSPAAGLHGSPGTKRILPGFCLHSVLSGPFAQGQCWVRDAGQEGQSGSTEPVALLSAMEQAECISGVPWKMANVAVRPLPLSQMGCSSQERFPITGKGQPCSKKREKEKLGSYQQSKLSHL